MYRALTAATVPVIVSSVPQRWIFSHRWTTHYRDIKPRGGGSAEKRVVHAGEIELDSNGRILFAADERIAAVCCGLR
jgi:hypothetical protein